MQTIFWTVLGVIVGCGIFNTGMGGIIHAYKTEASDERVASYMIGILFVLAGFFVANHNINEIQRWYDVARPVLGV